MPGKIAKLSVLGAALALLISSVASLATTINKTNDRFSCVVGWINGQDAIGAGAWWEMRAIKARLDDPSKLIQLNKKYKPDKWLVELQDFGPESIEFIVADSEKNLEKWNIPPEIKEAGTTVIDCGRYLIMSFDGRKIPIQRLE